MKIRVATRKSALALAQTRMIMAQLQARFPELVLEEVHVVTEGDRVQDRALSSIGGKGLFVKELERALQDDRADVAVHSMKDLPLELAEGLCIAAVPARESPWDVLVTRDGRILSALVAGARVGTGAPRRALQLKQLRSELVIEGLRGNVDTRLRKLNEGVFDAVVLAEAGLRRLGVAPACVVLREMVPAATQGLLALEARERNENLVQMLRSLEDRSARIAATAERAVLRALGASCTTPVGAYANEEGSALVLRGFLATEDGSRAVTTVCEGLVSAPEEAGVLLASKLRSGLNA